MGNLSDAIMNAVMEAIVGDNKNELRHMATRELRDTIITAVLEPIAKLYLGGVGRPVDIGMSCAFEEDGSELAWMFLPDGKTLRVMVTALEGDDAENARALFADTPVDTESSPK